MKPFLNLAQLDAFTELDTKGFKESYCDVGEKIGAQRLGYNVVILQPGCKSCPFHNHHNNEEMFLILAGEGTLRFGEQSYTIKQHDIIACPPGGRSVAHQIINTGSAPLHYLALSTNEPVDICEYPDSNKVLSMVGQQGQRSFQHIARLSDAVDYFEGEG